MKKSISIIGSGFSSLSAACYLAKMGHQVEVYEKNNDFGGRARQFKEDGFTFDMGPSWYWMPDVFERFFKDFGLKKSCICLDTVDTISFPLSASFHFPTGQDSFASVTFKLIRHPHLTHCFVERL